MSSAVLVSKAKATTPGCRSFPITRSTRNIDARFSNPSKAQISLTKTAVPVCGLDLKISLCAAKLFIEVYSNRSNNAADAHIYFGKHNGL